MTSSSLNPFVVEEVISYPTRASKTPFALMKSTSLLDAEISIVVSLEPSSIVLWIHLFVDVNLTAYLEPSTTRNVPSTPCFELVALVKPRDLDKGSVLKPWYLGMSFRIEAWCAQKASYACLILANHSQEFMAS